MGMLQGITGTSRALAALGIDEMEERIYRYLLAHRLATADQVSQRLSVPIETVQWLLVTMEAKGLATYSPEDNPFRYIAAPPELAIEALASQRKADIERARSTIADLKAEAANSGHDQEQYVELLIGHSAVAQMLAQMHETVQKEMFGFQCAPWIVPEMEQPAIKPKVCVRRISDSSFLVLPGAWERIRADVKKGEEARVFSALPFKMMIVDRRIGFLSLKTEDPGGPMLLIRSCALLDALCMLFDLTWERANLISITHSGELNVGTSNGLSNRANEQMIALLAAGMNDKRVAYEMGISIATLNRRLADLIKSWGTRTRFQLGWRAALNAQQHSGSSLNYTNMPFSPEPPADNDIDISKI